MVLFNGKKFAAEKEAKLKSAVVKLRQRGTIPRLVSVLVGDNPESELYLSLKGEAAGRIGVEFEVKRFSKDVGFEKIIGFLGRCNRDRTVGGIVIQLPFPKQSSIYHRKTEVLSAIDPEKDVDCLTPENLGLVAMGKPRFLPATVKAVIEIIASLKSSLRLREAGKVVVRTYRSKRSSKLNRWLSGENVCLVGASDIVGKPLAMMFLNLGATVTVCQDTTKKLPEFTQKADILISATGVPGLIKKEMIKNGVVVVDVGIFRLVGQGSKVVGDVDPKAVEVARFLTPVPGGVGPVTVVSLFENLLEAYRRSFS
jgi:methylenetetrahydrofolate dehydrogenase (NADP+)/methenyltetrahydrofolate cyclohydrolase